MATFQDLQLLIEAGDEVFDYPVIPASAKEFLNDPRHHLAIAVTNDQVVGMASAFHYIHPDKNTELFINEVGVMDEFQNQGIGTRLTEFLVDFGKGIGCQNSWIVTEKENSAARRAYAKAKGKEDPTHLVMYEWSEKND